MILNKNNFFAGKDKFDILFLKKEYSNAMSELENKIEEKENELQPKVDLSWIPEGKEPLADGDYDMIFLGTGLKECILEAGSRRIRPLVMTTTTTVVALIPIMWSTSTGSEVMKPMAIPTLGGMLVELVTLFIVPVVYSYFEQRKMERENLLN